MSILIIGDSFSGPDNNLTVWSTLLGQRLNKKVYNHANPGSGYVNPGLGWPARFSRQALVHPEFNPSEIELVILFGSCNDRWYVDPYFRSTVFATHREILREYPSAHLLIVGPQWSGPDAIPAEIRSMRDVINQEMWGYAWEHVYVDPVPDNQADWWFPPTRPELWGPDKFHPNQLGHNQIESKIEPHARQLLGL